MLAPTLRHYLAIAAALLLCCLECSNARADEPARVDARQALSVLCPGRLALAPVFDRAAKRYDLPPALLVAVARNETNCNPHKVGKGGESGAMQVRPGTIAAGNVSLARLDRPAVGIDLGARHLARCLRLCGDFAGALGVYSGIRTCKAGRASGYARRVLGFLDDVLGRERRS